jgi:hypothetical protein
MVTDILIDPVGDKFDVARVESYLASMPHVARDVHDSTTFMLASSAEQLEEAREARREDSIHFPMSVILVQIKFDRIEVSFRTAHVEPAVAFVGWLHAQYQLRFTDEEQNELPDSLDYLFE